MAFNIQGNVTSLASDPMTLASVPETPTVGPTNDASVTNTMQIGVTYDEITGDGGSPILSYELQMGSESLNDFQTVSGVDPQTL